MRDILGQLKAIDLKSIDLQDINKKRLGTAAATLVIALGAGYYMQNGQLAPQGDVAAGGDAAPAMVQTASVLPSASVVAPEEDDASNVDLEDSADIPAVETAAEELVNPTVLADVAPEPATVPEEAFDLAALEVMPEPAEAPAPVAALQADKCTPILTGEAGDFATISVEISAPCHAETEVEFAHAGLRFTERLDAEGKVQLDLPAMLNDAEVTAYLNDDSTAQLAMTIPDADQYRRVALVWHGATGLQLHAFEEGADYGGIGHIWAEQPGDLTRVSAGQGGYATVLGSVAQGYAADIYTFPAYMMRSLSGPEISIEAQILETTCDSKIRGTYLRGNGKSQPKAFPVQIAAPGCDAVGEYLVLQNMPQDLRIALN